jgi:hypothetical protein
VEDMAAEAATTKAAAGAAITNATTTEDGIAIKFLENSKVKSLNSKPFPCHGRYFSFFGDMVPV